MKPILSITDSTRLITLLVKLDDQRRADSHARGERLAQRERREQRVMRMLPLLMTRSEGGFGVFQQAVREPLI